MLEPATSNMIPGCNILPPSSVEIDGEPEYKVSEISDFKINKCQKCKLLYLIKWFGYKGKDEEFEWLPA